ncbi:acyltransferase family protein [Ottowia sp.]|jgi:peptidoglycan/LPS O-acetylase OafA/YrhL|uniref:acyltransferase family protein n=1 Tax=Ottowia sp. TaxID=1898956 RepID=UPI0025CD0012|nr:acyltransferase family protein [Ottowia sp.]MBK6612780.1 acyltransferase family protein [Ottowia sp.]MBK6748092.1 acyltransferase family protein [Ottowia sp.]
MPPSPVSSPWPLWGKALASQLIVWHHLVHYGPLPDALRERLPALVRWLDTQALMAVQVFLVTGGYLAARSLWPAPGEPRVSVREWPARVGRRCARLLPVYLLALLAAALAAAVARACMVDEDTPAAPTLAQVLAHAALLQDVADQPALSAGVWYVAIDLQLFALLAALAALAGTAMRPRTGGTAGLALVAAGVAASLLAFNLMPEGDMWAPYFFGAYGLGVLAAWGEGRRVGVTALLLALVGAALLVEWRDRIALAGARRRWCCCGSRGARCCPARPCSPWWPGWPRCRTRSSCCTTPSACWPARRQCAGRPTTTQCTSPPWWRPG